MLIGESYVGCCTAAALELVDQPILEMCQHVGISRNIVDLKCGSAGCLSSLAVMHTGSRSQYGWGYRHVVMMILIVAYA
jgi:hypothetical protein